jgi:hypothetical protein
MCAWNERERIELLFRAEPHEAAAARLDGRLKRGRVARPGAAVDAVGRDDEVRLVARGCRLVVLHVGLEHELHAQFLAALLQDVQQALAADAAEPVAAGRDALALEEDVDVVPVIERLQDAARRRLVGRDEVRERLVGEYDAPTERVVRPVAFDDDDAVRRILLLHQQGEVQAGGPAADADDVHDSRSL